MNYSNGQCCGGDAGLAGTTNYCGCGCQYPVVPGLNPALQTWNGQNFVVSDGSAQNPITLTAVQHDSPTNAQFILALNSKEQLSLIPNPQNQQIVANIAIVYAIALG